MFAIADCNNFYVSCERVFNPALNNKPVVVLSNNDGCIISRSQEAKDIGIKMGDPPFQIEPLLKQHKVEVFSSNYTLYGDMSRRVMATLSTFVPQVEIYSIDECFLDFSGFETYHNIKEIALNIRSTVIQNTGIPICIGIAPTKTLAKVANKLAKKKKDSGGVFIIEEEVEIKSALEKFEIGDVWGIGHRYAKMLKEKNIHTALDFTYALPNWVKAKMSVVGLRTWYELRGLSCIEMETVPPSKQNICCSRSFGEMLEDYTIIEEALSNFTATVALKLRKQKTCAKLVTVFIYTNYFRKDLPQYSNSVTLQLPVPSNSTFELIKYACIGLKKIFRANYKYKKVGVMVSEIMPEDNIVHDLFDTVDRERHKIAMAAMDRINIKFSNNKVKTKVAHQVGKNKFKLKQEKISKAYTTNFDDLIEVW